MGVCFHTPASLLIQIMQWLSAKGTRASLTESCSTFTVAHHKWVQKQADRPVWVLTIHITITRRVLSQVTRRQQKQISLKLFCVEWHFNITLQGIKNSMQSLRALAPLKRMLLSRTPLSVRIHAAIRTGSGRQNNTPGPGRPTSCVTLFSKMQLSRLFSHSNTK